MCQRRFECESSIGDSSSSKTGAICRAASKLDRGGHLHSTLCCWVHDAACRNSHQRAEENDLSPNLHLIRGMTDTHGLNLTTHRKTESVWERSGWDGTREQLALTRWLVGIGGGALAVQGLRQRSVPGWLLAGIGTSLAWWALTGEGDLSEVRRWYGSALERVGLTSEDRVHDESAESFPASDAPSWTPTVGTGLSDRARVR